MECSKNSLLYKYVGRFCFLLMEKKECFMSWCSEETRSDEETGFDTTPAPSVEWMPVHSLSSYLRFALPLVFFSSSISWVLLLLECSVSAVIPVVPPLPGGSDQGKRCLFLFSMHAGRLVSFVCCNLLWGFFRGGSQGLQATNLNMNGSIFIYFFV